MSDMLLPRVQLGGSGLPAGVVPNYINPPNAGHTAVVTGIVLLCVAAVVVSMKASMLKLGSEKWKLNVCFSILAFLLAIAHVAVISVDIEQYGMGRHIWDIPVPNFDVVYRLLNLGYLTYNLGMMFAKLAVLALYIDVFRINRTLRIQVFTLMGLTVAYCMAFVFVDVFRCSPQRKVWYPVTEPGSCINGVKEQIALGTINVVTDVMILIVPLPIIWKLQLPRNKFWAVMGVFCVGVFTVAAAIARTIISANSLTLFDQTWGAADELLWLNIELLVGIICGSLLATLPFCRYVATQTKFGSSLASLVNRSSRGSSGSGGSGGSGAQRSGEKNRNKHSKGGAGRYPSRPDDGSAQNENSCTELNEFDLDKPGRMAGQELYTVDVERQPRRGL